ncbi:MAG: hypothetical protein DKT66_19790 [Candidatus Melainabacteria bacterium]|nr:MAG: hypothetical protein DKT66_19790 [Candidatus Melainabacteria bacterium]
MNKPNIHVVRKEDKWAVKRENVNGYAATFDTQADADECGRKLAKQDGVEFYLHGEDGSIRLRDSYGNDPRDVPG